MALGRDGIAGLILLAISLTLLVQSFGLPHMPLVPVGPGFYPRIVLSFLAATSAVMVARDLLRGRAPAPGAAAAGAAEPGPRRRYGLVAAIFAVAAGYVGLLPFLGYRISTALFVGALHAAIERPVTARQWALGAAVAIGATAVTYAVFEHYLLVLLPRGSWTGW